jgi:UDP-N-acetylmuramoylalanine--D-glutamate ligase
MLLSELASRDIAILGAGREGIAAWRWLRRHFPEKRLTVYEELRQAKEPGLLMNGPLDRLLTGPFEIETLARHDLLIRSPGVSPYRSELAELRNRGMRFSSASSLWFAQHPADNTICITGTKGKSTTAALTAHLLQAAGCKVALAGNIGQPLLECENPGVDWWVIELSSYQLADLQAKPRVAAILNLTDEHLDWHGGTLAYQRDKLRIVELAAGAPLIANLSDDLLAAHLAGRDNVCWFGGERGFHVRNNELWRGSERLDQVPRESLPGPHNLANLAAALTILEQAGYGCERLARSLASFAGLPHRLQSLGLRDGVKYVSDSLSTTPVATMAALEALSGERIILLVGGMDRGVDWRPLMPHMKEHVPHAVICLPDSGTDIAEVMEASGLDPAGGIQCASSLESAMRTVSGLVKAGDTVLLSPGAPSFPRFRDYEDRGRHFAKFAGF